MCANSAPIIGGILHNYIHPYVGVDGSRKTYLVYPVVSYVNES
jgi:hypothetical protein